MNEANTLHITGHGQTVSSEDYLLSICHLAHPTLPTRVVSPSSRHSQQLDTSNQRLQLSGLGAPSGNFKFNHTGEIHAIYMQQGEEKELDTNLIFGNSDPLEYLYGHQSNLSGGVQRAITEGRFIGRHGSLWEGQARPRPRIPRASSPDLPRQRKSNFPELHTNTSFPNSSPKHSLVRSEARRGSPADRGAEGEKQTANKQSLISQWISDCRSVWREARARACMLPAIAEV